jgi:hypothetical protein
MYIGALVVTLAACPYVFQLDWLNQSCATAVCVWSCFITMLRLRCRKISNNGTLTFILSFIKSIFITDRVYGPDKGLHENCNNKMILAILL